MVSCTPPRGCYQTSGNEPIRFDMSHCKRGEGAPQAISFFLTLTWENDRRGCFCRGRRYIVNGADLLFDDDWEGRQPFLEMAAGKREQRVWVLRLRGW